MNSRSRVTIFVGDMASVPAMRSPSHACDLLQRMDECFRFCTVTGWYHPEDGAARKIYYV
jgi:hypothetical protein